MFNQSTIQSHYLRYLQRKEERYFQTISAHLKAKKTGYGC